jgi:bacterioferritin-associated ferredoxin
MWVCLCNAVTSDVVSQVISDGARSTKQVAQACGAGAICGRCRHTVRGMIAAYVAANQDVEPPAGPRGN